MATAVENQPPIPGKNKYIAWNAVTNTFDEYPIKLSEVVVGNFLELIVSPPVRRPGFLSYKKQIVQVSLHDLLRNHINVTKLYARPNDTGTSTDSTGSNTAVGAQSSAGTIQCGAQAGSGDVLDQESSLYWKEQMQSLHYSEDPEEGWDVETTPQP